ncbi:hypothetical protein BLNAU_16115 [Blattamonas nauphoetae]|uniref:Uncharacterized protein n=1 Tax=Blattamonas nauphoetae TaxID=2049346 RepID=A0ABQ9XE13_9EUKA|nr:hypothetical protein BLNAU_16115 [Blattamonas nauphoetae]
MLIAPFLGICFTNPLYLATTSSRRDDTTSTSTPPSPPDEQSTSFFNIIPRQPSTTVATTSHSPSDEQITGLLDPIPRQQNKTPSSPAITTPIQTPKSNRDLTWRCSKVINLMNQLDWKHLDAIRNDLSLGKDMGTPRMESRWKSKKLTQFNSLADAPIGKVLSLVGLVQVRPISKRILQTSLVNTSERDIQEVRDSVRNTEIHGFNLDKIWRELAGPDASKIRDRGIRSQQDSENTKPRPIRPPNLQTHRIPTADNNP